MAITTDMGHWPHAPMAQPDPNNLSYRIMKEVMSNPIPMAKAQTFADAGFDLTDEEAQQILDAYGAFHPELATVAKTTSLADVGAVSPKDVAQSVATQAWENFPSHYGGYGFMRVHAALLVGGVTSHFQSAVEAANPKATDHISAETISAVQALASV